MVFTGLISYSLYLWHWPILVFSKHQTLEPLNMRVRIALLAFSAILATLSWKYIETPFRKRRLFCSRHQIFSFAGASIVIMLTLGVLVYHTRGVYSRFSGKVLSNVNSRLNRAFLNNISLQQAVTGQFVELGSQATNQPISILIWGDSHAMSVTPVLDELCRRFAQRGIQATHSATAPVLGFVGTDTSSLMEDSPAFNNAVLTFIAQRHVKNVVITAAWNSYPATDLFRKQLLATVRAIIDSGARVYVLKDVPAQRPDIARLTEFFGMHNGDLEKLGVTRESHEMKNSELRQTFEEISQMGATVLDPAEYFLNSNGLYGVVHNDQILYCDAGHLTVEGAKILAPLFEPIFHIE